MTPPEGPGSPWPAAAEVSERGQREVSERGQRGRSASQTVTARVTCRGVTLSRRGRSGEVKSRQLDSRAGTEAVTDSSATETAQVTSRTVQRAPARREGSGQHNNNIYIFVWHAVTFRAARNNR